LIIRINAKDRRLPLKSILPTLKIAPLPKKVLHSHHRKVVKKSNNDNDNNDNDDNSSKNKKGNKKI